MLINNEKFVFFSFAGFLLIALSFKGIDTYKIPHNDNSINYSDSVIPDSSSDETPIIIDPLSYDTSDLFSRCWHPRSTFAYGSERGNGFTDSTHVTLLGADSSWAFPVMDRIVSKFGYRGRHHLHKGLDIHLRRGQKVHAAFAGKVRYAKYNSGGYGYLVIIRHYNGTETYYAHLNKLLVSSNDEVKAGDVIGLGGNTGTSSGPHLHFEIRLEDKAINPEKIFNLTNHSLVVNKLVLNNEIFSGRGKVSSISSRTKFENADKEGIFRCCDHKHDALKENTTKNVITAVSNKAITKIENEEKQKIITSLKSSKKSNSSSKSPSSSKKTKQSSNKSTSIASNSTKKFHYIKKGDCVYSIARNYGVSVNSIYRYNNLNSKSVLQVNQKLRIK